ncbi:MAG: SulP family inorganic anion transporter [Hyphomicrobiaceae bacterium]
MLWRRLTRDARGAPTSLWREALAGGVGAIILLAYCLSFAALIFDTGLHGGLAAGLWGLLLATAAATIIAAIGTTLPPQLQGPRNPVVAVMSVLAGVVAADVTAAGGTAEAAANHALLALAGATWLTGLTLLAIGYFRLGQLVRFIPFPVIAGFLGASGTLLVLGGIKVALGRAPTPAALLAATHGELLRLAIALGFTATAMMVARTRFSARSLPVLLVAATLALQVVLRLAGAGNGWYLADVSGLMAWSPLALSASPVDWMILAGAAPEILSLVGVAVIALLLDVTSREVQLGASADMDREFRLSGLANLVLPFGGGLHTGLAVAPSRMIDSLHGRTRASGLFGGLILALVVVAGLDIGHLVPMPILGGLIVYLGLGILSDAFQRKAGERSHTDLALSLAIMVTIVRFGYLTGVILGLVGACILFAVRYSRIEAIKRHVTRRELTSPVERAPELSRRILDEGHRIRILWLAGYIFFGSSNRLYEEIKRSVGHGKAGERRWIVMDLSAVTGIDSSAHLSFMKLAAWARDASVEIALAGASPQIEARIAGAPDREARQGFHVFHTRGEALEWCEEQLLAQAACGAPADTVSAFVDWLARELGADAARRLVSVYLQRRPIAAHAVVCSQGEPSDTIDFIAAGSVSVAIRDGEGRSFRVRRLASRTIIGEMGFFRGSARAATVTAAEPSVVYALARADYDRLAREEPALAKALLEFVVRALADRLDLANREASALM